MEHLPCVATPLVHAHKKGKDHLNKGFTKVLCFKTWIKFVSIQRFIHPFHGIMDWSQLPLRLSKVLLFMFFCCFFCFVFCFVMIWFFCCLFFLPFSCVSNIFWCVLRIWRKVKLTFNSSGALPGSSNKYGFCSDVFMPIKKRSKQREKFYRLNLRI